MQVSAGLLSIIARSGDAEAQAIQREWYQEEASYPLLKAGIQCYYFGEGDYFALCCPPPQMLPKRTSTLVGLPKASL